MGSYLAMDKLAALLKAKRGKRGLRETAKAIGNVSASTLSRIEQGKMPDLDTFMRLCDWLEVSPNEFFSSDAQQQTGAETKMLPLAPGMNTPEIIEVHLRADKELDPETADALANMVKAAYTAIQAGKLGRKREG